MKKNKKINYLYNLLLESKDISQFLQKSGNIIIETKNYKSDCQISNEHRFLHPYTTYRMIISCKGENSKIKCNCYNNQIMSLETYINKE